MPTAYRTEAAPQTRRRRRRKRHTLLKLLLLVLVVFAAYRLTDGFALIRHGGGSAPMDNIETTFNLNLASLEFQITDEMEQFTASENDIARLRALAEKRDEYADGLDFMIRHIGIYSQEAVNTVLLSPEKLDFVLLEPFVPPDDSGTYAEIKVKKGEIPFLLQYDSRWAFHRYGSSVMGYTACGPTCLSMVAIGLTGNAGYTPAYVSDLAEQSGYYVSGAGTAWSLFTGGASMFGLNGQAVSVDKQTMQECLKKGGALIASMLPGDFTNVGHFIVIHDYDAGGFDIYDPSSVERSRQNWTFSDLQPQIAQLWNLTA